MSVEKLPRVKCANCDQLQIPEQILIAAGCVRCLSPLCLICGCTDDRACPPGCQWLTPFVCDNHFQTLINEIERHFGSEAAFVATEHFLKGRIAA